jgi:hypothetical protein
MPAAERPSVYTIRGAEESYVPLKEKAGGAT